MNQRGDVDKKDGLTSFPQIENERTQPSPTRGPLPPQVGPYKQIIEETEQKLKEELTSIQYDEKEVLLRALASVQLSLAYERAYKDIFKSQIDALQRLNATGSGVLTREALSLFYENAKNKYSSAYDNFSFDNWLNFLFFSELIKEVEGKINITTNGKAFLLYILERGYEVKFKSL